MLKLFAKETSFLLPPRHRSRNPPGRSKHSTCHPWWCGGHIEAWLNHPWARHLGNFQSCCTQDCRSLQTSPARAPLVHQTHSRSWGHRSGLGWLPLPPTRSQGSLSLSRQTILARNKVTAWIGPGLGHGGLHGDLVGCIVSAKTNPHDLLARSSSSQATHTRLIQKNRVAILTRNTQSGQLIT